MGTTRTLKRINCTIPWGKLSWRTQQQKSPTCRKYPGCRRCRGGPRSTAGSKTSNLYIEYKVGQNNLHPRGCQAEAQKQAASQQELRHYQCGGENAVTYHSGVIPQKAKGAGRSHCLYIWGLRSLRKSIQASASETQEFRHKGDSAKIQHFQHHRLTGEQLVVRRALHMPSKWVDRQRKEWGQMVRTVLRQAELRMKDL